MWLILADARDPCGPWLVQGLAENRGAAVTLLTGDDLGRARNWQQRIDGGGVTSRLQLADGRWLQSGEIRGVLNRLIQVPVRWSRALRPKDRAYAMQEMSALYLSWLHGLPCPVLNRPSPQGLCGTFRHPFDWARLASQSGLAVRPMRCAVDDDAAALAVGTNGREPGCERGQVFVIGKKVIVAPPHRRLSAGLRSGCTQMGKLSECALLGLTFDVRTNDRWIFHSASPCPDLRPGGQGLLHALDVELSAIVADTAPPP